MYEGVVCICCMSTDNLVGLFAIMEEAQMEWSYANIIHCCFDIQVWPTEAEDSICEVCIQKLNEAVAFKRQILKCISLLTSVSLEKLLSDSKHLKVFGFKEKLAKDIIIDQVEHEPLREVNIDERSSDNNESCHSEVHEEETSINVSENDDNSQCNETLKITRTSPSNSKRKTKRKVGRPRKYPKITLPYEISSAETKCRECGSEFPNNLILKMHYNKHFPNFTCSKCRKSFMTALSLKKHELIHLDGPFRCDICQQEFRSINTMKSHKRYKHRTLPAYPCTHKQCAERFSTLAQRLTHVAHEHGLQRLYKCELCVMNFRSSTERSKHMLSKHKIKLYSCPLCEYKSRRVLMTNHLANKHSIGEKKYKCETCPSAFCRRSTLITHRRSHNDERRFKCRLCCKKFVQKCTLKYHVQTHIKKGEFIGDATTLMTHDVMSPESGRAEYLDEPSDDDAADADHIGQNDAHKWQPSDEVPLSVDNLEDDFKIEMLEDLVEDDTDLGVSLLNTFID